ncbi:PEGA domain-containing protein [Candidatus Poribacteria bacterium]|nr:PEGA domain-containing protein [Candidatus Poribacteria bacterium]
MLHLLFPEKNHIMIQSFVKTVISIIIIVISCNTFADAQKTDLINFRERWAILIGVGKYAPNSGIESLEWPVFDAQLMEKILVQYGGFAEGNIKTLVSHEATYLKINEAFSDFIDKVTREDLFVFYFSGRGARINDDLLPDEPDELDECLLPYDAVKKSKQNFLRDDELGEYLRKLGAKMAVIIIDSSYSGENGKGIDTEEAKTKLVEVDGITKTDSLPKETTVVFEASTPGGKPVGDGVFTRLFSPEYATDQDDNGDGFITVHEFFTYAKKRMNEQVTPHIGYGEAEARKIPLVRPPLLEVTSNPPDATIKIDGQNRGTTPSPKPISLGSGSHNLEVRKRGYKIWSRTIESIPGRQRIDFKLTHVEISGTVVYGKTPRLLANATVELLGTRHKTVTDEDGRFSFSEWEQYGIPRAGSYQIEISDIQKRIKKGQVTPVEIPEDFYYDIPLGEIQLTEVAKISFKVYTQDNKPIPDAVVLINQQQVIDTDRDGTYEIEIENPDFSIPFTVSREGYETYEGNIQVPADIGKPYSVLLQPAIHTFSVEVKSGNNPVPGIAVILNDTQLAGTTDSQGKIEDKKQLVPDELNIKLKKDEAVRELSKSEWTIEKTGKNEYKISITPQPFPVRVIDLSEKPISGVQIKGGLILAQTDDNGRADVLLLGKPGESVSLSFMHPSLPKPENRIVSRQTSEQIVSLPIPGEVSIILVVQDEGQKTIPEMNVKINNQLYGKTDSDGKIPVKYRIDLGNLEIFKSQLEFEKYGIPYRPVDLKHQEGNVYLATLHIEYSNMIVQIYTEINGKQIDLNLNPTIYIDGEAKVTQILPGNHELEVAVENDTIAKQSINVSPGEKKINIKIDQYRVWQLCLSLSQKTGKTEILESAIKVAEALGRRDMAVIFRKRQ